MQLSNHGHLAQKLLGEGAWSPQREGWERGQGVHKGRGGRGGRVSTKGGVGEGARSPQYC